MVSTLSIARTHIPTWGIFTREHTPEPSSHTLSPSLREQFLCLGPVSTVGSKTHQMWAHTLGAHRALGETSVNLVGDHPAGPKL